MKNSTADRPSIAIPPPLIFFALVGIGFFLEYLFPFNLHKWTWMPRIIVGGFFFLLSGLLALGSIRVLLRNKTPFDPSKPTEKLVQEGPFRISRNPMYLALLVLLFGIAVLTASMWFFLCIPALLIIFDYGAVRPEEEYLERNFGEAYSAYKAKVRRWL